jgi:hypothetical protein
MTGGSIASAVLESTTGKRDRPSARPRGISMPTIPSLFVARPVLLPCEVNRLDRDWSGQHSQLSLPARW